MSNPQHHSTPAPESGSDHAHDHAAMGLTVTDHSEMDHATMGHGEHGGHDDHAGHGGHEGHVAIFRRLFWIMLGISIPVLAFNSMFMSLIGITLPHNSWLPWISPLLGTLMYVWGGRPFLTGARDEIKARKPGMMLLISLGLTVALLSSWGASLGILHHGLDFWWELALLVVIMLLGHWIEMRSLAQTTSALDSLAALLPDTAERIIDGVAEEIAPADLELDNIVIVRPGGRVPADGVITQGTAEIDESMITGESRTVSRGPNSPVVAGTVSTDTAIRVRVTAIGADTALAGVQRLVSDAQASSSRAQRVADTAAGWLFWFALGAAIITATAWTLLGDPDSAVIRTITVLVIACPHALGLAIPLVVSIATERAAKAGVLIKDRLALEGMRQVTSVLFDKTGTLTVGEPVVTHIATIPGHSEEQVLALAAAAESDSEHPLARAILRAAKDRSLAFSPAADFHSAAAEGVRAMVNGIKVGVGGPHMLANHSLEPLAASEAWKASGATILHVIAAGKIIGALALADEIRPESRTAVDALHARGIEVVMITGDAAEVAESVAHELGIDRVFASVRPENKAAQVAALQAEGQKVAMVGDGVNDAPALAQADIGIAIGAGTDVAIASAGVILASDDPRSVLSVIDLSTASYRKMKQNLWWAAGYNLLSVPLAAGVLAGVGFILPMSVGAVLMSISTVVVALNAQLLRRLDLRPEVVTRKNSGN